MTGTRVGSAALLVGFVCLSCTPYQGPLVEPADQTGPEISVTRRGRALTLAGATLIVGDWAPDVVLTDRRGNKVRLADYRGKVLLLSVVPELGTAVCDRSTRYIDRSDLNDHPDVVIFTISTNSWGEQARWCSSNRVRRHMTLSDAPAKAFGQAYGLAIQEVDYLTRCVLVIDRDGVIRYIETQRDIGRMPNFKAAEQLARSLAGEAS